MPLDYGRWLDHHQGIEDLRPNPIRPPRGGDLWRTAQADLGIDAAGRSSLQQCLEFQGGAAAKTESVDGPTLEAIMPAKRYGDGAKISSLFQLFGVLSKDSGRCPDGTITVAPQGKDLAVGWFGNVQDTTVVAYG